MDADVPVHADYSTDWHHAFGGPLGSCQFKSCHEDFQVDEYLPFEPEGEGEHLFLLIEKKGDNTDWVADLLARHAKVKRQSVSYAGRKDRHGVTRQWFCVTLPGMADPDWSGFESDAVRILKQTRHRKKLKTGALKGNGFCITLREIEANRDRVEERLEQIAQAGVPNYFGEQRFGHQGRNIEKAAAMMAGKFRVQRNKRSVYLSAARSWLFNRVLSEKVQQQLWNQYLPGDALGFPDSGSLIFDAADDDIMARLNSGKLSPTSPLWGRGMLKVADEAKAFEESVASGYAALCDGLENAGLNQERRINRLIPEQMTWSWKDDRTLELSFRLPKGCFATTVLREVLLCQEQDRTYVEKTDQGVQGS
ncbi:tRNA pseudouridine(13) synthase TruD [Endozoicomonas ascidiicola]|uniref:tRNA pseudouridine(13) synthase TruD n=1 Tax=Endozoicomonas ascidiicola TaxID=1698521 RepID=UPI000A70AE87|nr:tRNA pseudouridine(13) synthase TruD [Endozoicomonas ascidiicola]